MMWIRYTHTHTHTHIYIYIYIYIYIFIYYYFLNLFYFIYFWLHWVFVAVRGLSLVAASGGYSTLPLRGLLIAVASLVAEHGL